MTPPQLPLLTHKGAQATHAYEDIFDVAGTSVARLSLAPKLLISQTLKHQKQGRPVPSSERERLLKVASEAFLREALGGVTFEDHCHLVSSVSGHSHATTRQLNAAVAHQMLTATERAQQARPQGSRPEHTQKPHSTGLWIRRGDTVGAVLAGNSPAIQNGWLQALALGFRVAVRPSRREPFTAYRAVDALRHAGFQATDVTYLPTSRDVAQEILHRADLGLTYGDQDVLAKYQDDQSVKVGGPGRSKTLIRTSALQDASVALEAAFAVSTNSGTACVNTSGLFVEGDHRTFARMIGAELHSQHERLLIQGQHLGPRVDQDTANSFVDVLRRVHPESSRSSYEDLITPHPDGGVILAPPVIAVEDPSHPAVNLELPFPSVTVAPWTPEHWITPLKDSLVVSVYGEEDDELIDELLHEESVKNVYVNTPTTYTDGLLPHEDYVGNFLMRNKAFAWRKP